MIFITTFMVQNWIKVAKSICQRHRKITHEEFIEEFGDCESHAEDMIKILLDEGFIRDTPSGYVIVDDRS